MPSKTRHSATLDDETLGAKDELRITRQTKKTPQSSTARSQPPSDAIQKGTRSQTRSTNRKKAAASAEDTLPTLPPPPPTPPSAPPSPAPSPAGAPSLCTPRPDPVDAHTQPGKSSKLRIIIIIGACWMTTCLRRSSSKHRL